MGVKTTGGPGWVRTYLRLTLCHYGQIRAPVLLTPIPRHTERPIKLTHQEITSRDIKQTDGCWFANCESGSGDKNSRQLSHSCLIFTGWTLDRGDKRGDDSCNSAWQANLLIGVLSFLRLELPPPLMIVQSVYWQYEENPRNAKNPNNLHHFWTFSTSYSSNQHSWSLHSAHPQMVPAKPENLKLEQHFKVLYYL